MYPIQRLSRRRCTIGGMEWLNYHHLLYFWVIAREGTIAQASKQLLLAQPTITGQIRALENSLGEKLFRPIGTQSGPHRGRARGVPLCQ